MYLLNSIFAFREKQKLKKMIIGLNKIKLSLFILALVSCHSGRHDTPGTNLEKVIHPSLLVLGTLQDAGSPHIACQKDCCKDLFNHPDPGRQVVSLGLVDPDNEMTILIEATPDIVSQMKSLKRQSGFKQIETPDAILITHAHIGHYTGLMYLGKEAMNADNQMVYVMPEMKTFLEQNGPWDQLVDMKNINLQELQSNRILKLSTNIEIKPIRVPHRDEYSETVGFVIFGPNKKVLFIPDIDKWEKWNLDIVDEIKNVDYAFLDATFYDGKELNTRDISQIPHPFVIESMSLFKDLSASEKSKIHFIHFNHTNALLDRESKQFQQVVKSGFNVAQINQRIKL
jgi:pyrroloquinoline quinone biosynthesis protein B